MPAVSEREDEVLTGPTPADQRPFSAKPVGLSELERSVIRLSRWDPWSSLHFADDWKSRIASWLGAYPPNALADPRLEAIRRYAVATRLRRGNDRVMAELLRGTDLSGEQAEELERIVAPWRTTRVDGSRWMLGLVLVVLVPAIYVTALRAIDDWLVAVLVTGLAVVLALSLTPVRTRGA